MSGNCGQNNSEKTIATNIWKFRSDKFWNDKSYNGQEFVESHDCPYSEEKWQIKKEAKLIGCVKNFSVASCVCIKSEWEYNGMVNIW